jgi:hypothetical protein
MFLFFVGNLSKDYKSSLRDKNAQKEDVPTANFLNFKSNSNNFCRSAARRGTSVVVPTSGQISGFILKGK